MFGTFSQVMFHALASFGHTVVVFYQGLVPAFSGRSGLAETSFHRLYIRLFFFADFIREGPLARPYTSDCECSTWIGRMALVKCDPKSIWEIGSR